MASIDRRLCSSSAIPLQLLLDYGAWMQWRIPYFNSFSYDIATLLTSGITALTAVYFIGSAIGAQRYLNTEPDLNLRRRASNNSEMEQNRTAIRRLMRRVQASGCLMLVIVVVLAVGTRFIFFPAGFTIGCVVLYLTMMANSLLRIDSFVPAKGAPIGPLRGTIRALVDWVLSLAQRYEKRLASSTSANPNQIVRAAKARQARRLSQIDHTGDAMLKSVKRRSEGSLDRQSGHELLNSFRISVSEPKHDASNQAPHVADQLKPWQRPGVSARFLDAFVRTHRSIITPDMTTTEVMERIIKPETAAQKCCYVELLASDKRCPPQWLGKTSHFASHWWGYKFLDLVAALRTFSATCSEPPFFFLDTMAINQHMFFLGSTSDQTTQEELLVGLRASLHACGNLLLCCMPGPSGDPGWMSPAPFTRIWCLFEVTIS